MSETRINHARQATERIAATDDRDYATWFAQTERIVQQAIDGAVAEREAEVERLREALEHYADQGNWSGGVGRYPVSCVYRSRDYSGYEIARQALAVAGQEGGG